MVEDPQTSPLQLLQLTNKTWNCCNVHSDHQNNNKTDKFLETIWNMFPYLASWVNQRYYSKGIAK